MHSVFVYGTLKRGFGNHHKLCEAPFNPDLDDSKEDCNRPAPEHAVYIGPYSTEERFLLCVGYIPYLLQNCDAVKEAFEQRARHIEGELWRVSSEKLAELDLFEGVHNNFYERITAQVVSMEDPSVREAAQVYVLSPESDSFKDVVEDLLPYQLEALSSY